jgi:hypothetical protein
MTDDKLNNISRAFAMALITIICILVFLAKAFGQDTGRNTGNHTHSENSFERFDNIRLRPPGKILNVERVESGTRIDVMFSTKNLLKYETLTLTKETKGDAVIKGGMFWIYLCQEDGYVYAVYSLTDPQKKALK